MGKYGFRELQFWKESKELASDIYKLTLSGEINKDFDIRSQIRRAVLSVPSNIAEGDERDTDKEAIRFFFIAKGSLAELITLFEISRDIGYLDVITFEEYNSKFLRISKMLGSLIKARGKGFKSTEQSAYHL